MSSSFSYSSKILEENSCLEPTVDMVLLALLRLVYAASEPAIRRNIHARLQFIIISKLGVLLFILRAFPVAFVFAAISFICLLLSIQYLFLCLRELLPLSNSHGSHNNQGNPYCSLKYYEAS